MVVRRPLSCLDPPAAGPRPWRAGGAPRLAAAILLLAALAPLSAASYHVSSRRGDDLASGTDAGSPWGTLGRLSRQRLEAGDRVLLERGGSWAEELEATGSGSAEQPITFGAFGEGAEPVVESLLVSGSHLEVEDLTVDHAKNASDAVRVRSAAHVVLRRLTVRNGTRDGVDIARSEDVRIESSLIHHFLAGSFNDQMDAHGVVATRTRGIALVDTEIHHVSGDSFQADPARDPDRRTDDILIDGCHFWTGPLSEDFNAGWRRTDNLSADLRQYPGENAVDTKVLKSGWETAPRMRITIRDTRAHGWLPDGFISNKAAFNMKEKIDARFDGVEVWDCDIAFRLRGTRGNADVTIANALVRSCRTAVRAEDDLAHLKLYHATFGLGLGTMIRSVGGAANTGGWDVRNCLFLDAAPPVAVGTGNTVVASARVAGHFVDAPGGDYHLVAGSSLIDAADPVEGVEKDRDGHARSAPVDVGAYEFSSVGCCPGGGARPSPPTDLTVTTVEG